MEGMRLIASLHPIIHLSLLISAFLNTAGIHDFTEVDYIPIGKWTNVDVEVRWLSYAMQFGHAFEVMTAILTGVLQKSNKSLTALGVVKVVSSIVFYLGPIICC